MADPVVTTLPIDTWVKVATNVTTGVIWERSSRPVILMTQRDTGGAAPTDDSDAVIIFRGGTSIQINSTAAKDVYLKAKEFAGEVRVDL